MDRLHGPGDRKAYCRMRPGAWKEEGGEPEGHDQMGLGDVSTENAELLVLEHKQYGRKPKERRFFP